MNSPAFHVAAQLSQDVRYACRLFWKKRLFALAAILPLALGVGATTALFSVVYAVVLSPPVFTDSDRIIDSFLVDKSGTRLPLMLTAEQLVQLRKADVVQDAIALDNWSMTLTGGELPESVQVNFYSGNGPAFLGLTPALGRLFTESEGRPGESAGRVVLLTNKFWRSHYGAQGGIVGTTIELDRKPYSVVGVIAERFDVALGDIVVPIDLKFDPSFAWGAWARLKPGISLSAAESGFAPLLEQFRKESPNRFASDVRVKISSFAERRRNTPVLPTLMFLFAAAALLLIVACVNVSILLLANGTLRQRELAIRHSIGASRRRLLGQLLIESLVLAVTGTSLGIFVAYCGVPAALNWLPPGVLPLPPAAIHVNLPVLLFTVAVSLLTGILFGLWPALSFSHDQSAILQSSTTRIASSIGQRRAHQILMTAQVTLTVVLLAGTGAAVRIVMALYQTELNFDPHNVMIATADLALDTYMDWSERAAFFERVRDRLANTPEVEAAGLIIYGGVPPRFGERTLIEIPGPASSEKDFTRLLRSSSELLSTLKVPLVQGRFWSAAENAQAAHLTVINEAMAKRFWPNENPINKRVRVPSFAKSNSQFVLAAPGSDGWFEIIGVVRNVPNNGLRDSTQPSMYVPHTLMLGDSANFVIRTRRDPMALVRTIREQVSAVDPHQPLRLVRTAEVVLMQQGWARERFVALLLSMLAVIALLVAAFGLYSVVSYSVSHRMREFGIRLAIGAQKRDVLGLAMKSPLVSITVGLTLGIFLSAGLNRALSKLTIGNLGDPVVLVLISVVLLVVTVIAVVIPARHATLVEPSGALRSE